MGNPDSTNREYGPGATVGEASSAFLGMSSSTEIPRMKYQTDTQSIFTP